MKTMYWLGSGTCASAVAACLTVLLSCGCNSDDTTITSQQTKYEVADEDGASENTSTGTSADTEAPAVTPGMAPAPGTSQSPAPSAPPPVASGAPSTGAPPKPPVSPQGNFNPYKPAGDSPEQLAAFLQEMVARNPSGSSPAEQMSDYRNMQDAVLAAADKLLSGTENTEWLVTAAEAKSRALILMSQMGDETARQRLMDFLKELTASGNEEVARFAQRRYLELAVFDYAQRGGQDAQALVDDVKAKLPLIGKDAQALQLVSNIARIFEQMGMADESLDVLRAIAKEFADVQDPELASQVAQITERLAVAELKLRDKMIAVLQKEPEAGAALVEAVNTLLSRENPGPTVFSTVRECAMLMETAAPELASQIYEGLGTAFADHADSQLQDEVKRTIELYGRRAAIVGKPFTVTGVTLQGKPFDWSQYKGKVVLVDFWATWCQPCLEEMSNIRENYDKYHEQGFEVVGVNLDDDPQAVQQFFQLQQLPWTTVFSSDPNARGFDNPLAVQCGVEAIPFLVLVDKDGTAVALNVRGPALGEKLAELLGQPAPETTPEP